MTHGREKSDSAIVAGKPTNKAEQSAAEPVDPFGNSLLLDEWGWLIWQEIEWALHPFATA